MDGDDVRGWAWGGDRSGRIREGGNGGGRDPPPRGRPSGPELLGAETMAAAERIKVQLTTVQNRYEAVLMTETIAMQARNDQLAAELRELDKRQRSD